MARFRGSLKGSAKAIVTRGGTYQSGIDIKAHGMNLGIEVIGRMVNGKETFDVYMTTGSGWNLTDTPVRKKHIRVTDTAALWASCLPPSVEDKEEVPV